MPSLFPHIWLIICLNINSQLEINPSQNFKGRAPLPSSFQGCHRIRFLFFYVISLGFFFPHVFKLCFWFVWVFFHNDVLWCVSFFIHSTGHSSELFHLEAYVLKIFLYYLFDNSSPPLSLFSFFCTSSYSDVKLLRMILSYFSLHSTPPSLFWFLTFLQGFFNFIFKTLYWFIDFYHTFNFQVFFLILWILLLLHTVFILLLCYLVWCPGHQ